MQTRALNISMLLSGLTREVCEGEETKGVRIRKNKTVLCTYDSAVYVCKTPTPQNS